MTPLRTMSAALFGMDSRTAKMFTMFCEGPARNYLKVVPVGQHDFLVINMDGIGAASQAMEARKRFSCPMLLLSIEEKKHPDGVWVPLPIRTENLINALKIINGKILKKEVPEHPSTVTEIEQKNNIIQKPQDSNSRERVGNAAKLAFQENQLFNLFGTIPEKIYLEEQKSKELFFRPDDYFIGVLRNAYVLAKSNGAPVSISGLGRDIIVFPDSRICIDIREQKFRPLCSSIIRNTNIAPAHEENLSHIKASYGGEQELQSIYNVLWKSALWASRGRIPLGTDPDQPVSLHSWPNFTRITITPGALQMAALWSSNPSSLNETARIFGIPHRHVFSFYSSCHALDLVDQEKIKKHIPTQKAKNQQSPEKRGFLVSMLKKLGLS